MTYYSPETSNLLELPATGVAYFWSEDGYEYVAFPITGDAGIDAENFDAIRAVPYAGCRYDVAAKWPAGVRAFYRDHGLCYRCYGGGLRFERWDIAAARAIWRQCQDCKGTGKA
jgi:hypothetical protein